jgi:hypothetical protein
MKPQDKEKPSDVAQNNGDTTANNGPSAYLSSQDTEYLARMNMALLSELWITRDRVAVLEEMLANGDTITRQRIDNYRPSAEFADYLESLRAVVVENVVGAPFQSTESVDSLIQKGRELARLHREKI